MVPPSCLRAARTSLPVSYEAARVDATATAPALRSRSWWQWQVSGRTTPKRGVRRFKRVPLDLKHLGLGGGENRLGLQKRSLEVEILELQYLGRE